VEQQSATRREPLLGSEGIADFNGDGYSDILWRDRDGQVSFWYMQHSTLVGDAESGGKDPVPEWEIQDIGDFDGDGCADILWRHVNGSLAMWFRGRHEYRQAYPTWQNRSGWISGTRGRSF
jgi:hypothetical protein